MPAGGRDEKTGVKNRMILFIQEVDNSLETMIRCTRCAFVCLVEARIRPVSEEVKWTKMEINQGNNGYVKASKNDKGSTKCDRISTSFASFPLL
jgi:hypothetical protein